MRDQRLEQLKREYQEIPIPQELGFIVKKALKDSRKETGSVLKRARIVAASAAAAVVILAMGVNGSPAFAKALLEVPVVGSIVKVLTFGEYTVNEDTFNAEIKTPKIQGLVNKDLESSLNEKYLVENRKLYEQFMTEMNELKGNGGGHLGVNSGYVVKTDNDRILSIGRYVVNTVGSSSTTFKYDTIDKKNEVLITLPSLFKDAGYLDVISKNIKEQMIAQHKADNKKFYWVEGIEQQGTMKRFERIAEEQNFYINTESKLVISFNKYEVAPGYMAVVEFVIPTELLADILVGNKYLK